jgi:beta-aspartyl-peptidase (threonine type)
MPAIVIHGGAGTIREEYREAYRLGLDRAREAGYRELLGGGDSVRAVLAAVTSMEDDPEAFNAGTGGAPTRDGMVECDAAIMTGDGSSGAVAAVTRARNPVLLAELVRTSTPHALIVGAGADALVGDPIDNRQLLTGRTRLALERWRSERVAQPRGSSTVGAVALDDDGNIAAATSTGGVLGQWPGRVGDSPLIGAGTYADRSVGVSCTGKGEAFIRAVTAKTLACAVAAGKPLKAALQAALDDIARQDADGGLISLLADGRLGLAFNSAHMAYAWRTPTSAEANIGLEPAVLVVPA